MAQVSVNVHLFYITTVADDAANVSRRRNDQHSLCVHIILRKSLDLLQVGHRLRL